MRRAPLPIALAVAPVIALGGAGSAHGQAGTVVLTADQALNAAERLIAQDALDDAETVLRRVATGDPATTDLLRVDYLAGLVAEARGQDAEAERLYRSVLDHDPALSGARFRLAGVQARRGAHGKAERNFRRVARDESIAGPLAAMGAAGARRAGEDKLFATSVAAGVVPSTNVNAGTSADSMLVFGFIPVPLDDETRARSGLGLRYAVSAAARPRLGEGTRAHLSVQGTMTDHSGARFDDAALGGQAQLVARRGGRSARLSLGATRRLFGGDAYLTRSSVGAGIGLTPHARVRLGLDASAALADYARNDARDGWVYAAGLGVEVAAGRAWRLGGTVSAAREDADAPTLANDQGTVRLSASRALPLGLRGRVAPAYTVRRFDEAAALFGALREDEAVSVDASVEAASWDWLGLSPSLGYSYTDNRSTLPINAYTRHAVDVGVARRF